MLSNHISASAAVTSFHSCLSVSFHYVITKLCHNYYVITKLCHNCYVITKLCHNYYDITKLRFGKAPMKSTLKSSLYYCTAVSGLWQTLKEFTLLLHRCFWALADFKRVHFIIAPLFLDSGRYIGILKEVLIDTLWIQRLIKIMLFKSISL